MYFLWFLVALAVVFLDQLSKMLTVMFIKPVDTVPLWEDVLHLTYVENRGAAFGMLSDARWVFLLVSTIAIVGLTGFMIWKRPSNKLECVALTFIIGGGIGNMIDRLALGYVVDMIDFRLINFAVFNVADSFVCIGVGLLMLYLIRDMVREYRAEKLAMIVEVPTAFAVESPEINQIEETTRTTTMTPMCDDLRLSMPESDIDTDMDTADTDRAMTETYTVPADGAGERLDRFLSDVGNITRAAAVRLIETDCVTLQTAKSIDTKAAKNTRLNVGDCVTVTYPAPEDYDVAAEDIPLDIVFEDKDILVINKPVGMVVHPAPGNYTGTLVNALMHHCGDDLSGVGGVRRPGIVHRIDKDTSGLLVVAKNDAAHNHLAEQLKTHTVSRVYHAICLGNLKEDRGTVELAIGRNSADRKKMATFPKGSSAIPGGATVREAVTHYTVLERFPLGARWGQAFTYVQCELETGRTHQIRVHLAAGGHPLLGDPVYGGDGTRFGKAHATLLHGQCLHASELRLIHPRTGEPMHFTCPLPTDFERLLTILRRACEP